MLAGQEDPPAKALIADINVRVCCNVSSRQLCVIEACRQVDIGDTAKCSCTYRHGSRTGSQSTTVAITTSATSATSSASATSTTGSSDCATCAVISTSSAAISG